MKCYGVGKFLDILPYASVIGILKPLEKFFESARDPFANNKICHNLFSVKKNDKFWRTNVFVATSRQHSRRVPGTAGLSNLNISGVRKCAYFVGEKKFSTSQFFDEKSSEQNKKARQNRYILQKASWVIFSIVRFHIVILFKKNEIFSFDNYCKKAIDRIKKEESDGYF